MVPLSARLTLLLNPGSLANWRLKWPHQLLPARLTGKRRRGAFAFTLRTFATTGHPPAGLALEVTGQAQTRRGCLMSKHRQAGITSDPEMK
jgi:hypothetical protein